MKKYIFLFLFICCGLLFFNNVQAAKNVTINSGDIYFVRTKGLKNSLNVVGRYPDYMIDFINSLYNEKRIYLTKANERFHNTIMTSELAHATSNGYSDVEDRINEINKNRKKYNYGTINLVKIDIFESADENKNNAVSNGEFIYLCWNEEENDYLALSTFEQQYKNASVYRGTFVAQGDSMSSLYIEYPSLIFKKVLCIDKDVEDISSQKPLTTFICLETVTQKGKVTSSDYEKFLMYIGRNNSYRKENKENEITKERVDIIEESTKMSLGYIYVFFDGKENLYTSAEYTDEIEKVKGSSDFWGDASLWFGLAKGSYETPKQVSEIISVFTDMINVVGTTVIIIATIVLGIKYIIGSVESQTSAKEGLITLFVACVFFFGWTAISNLLYGGNEMDFIFTSSSDLSYKDMVGRIFMTFSYIAQFVVVGTIIYVGIKYIFAGASGRAELKGKSVYFIIGIILVFATSNVLDFVSKIINESFVK